MTNKTKTVSVVAGIILVIAIAFALFNVRGKTDLTFLNFIDSKENGTVAGVNSEQDNEYVAKLADFMTSQGAVLYGAYWCPHCQEQKKIFGDAIKKINYVECDSRGPNANPDECRGQNIKSYPTWIYQGQQYVGTQSLSQLAKIVGFTQ